MRARELPAAAALGLLASLLAHTAAYGGGHAMGGSYHSAIVAAAAAAALAAFVSATSLAWAGAGRARDGSILAARLRSVLPSWSSLVLFATAWFALGERIEAHHDGAAPLLIALALAACAWLVLACVRALLAFLAEIVIAIRAGAFAPRSPSLHRTLARATPIVRTLLLAHRRYARPPPSAIAGV